MPTASQLKVAFDDAQQQMKGGAECFRRRLDGLTPCAAKQQWKEKRDMFELFIGDSLLLPFTRGASLEILESTKLCNII